jgi:hypothetical protein
VFDIPNTADNTATAAAVNARLNAEAALNRAKSRTWTLAGICGSLALLGIGVGAAFAGYHTNFNEVSGKVQLEDTTLKLDASGQTVRLDTTGASVRVNGGSFPNAPIMQAPSGARVVVDYNVFHRVDFGGGEVITGWEYNSSQDSAPAHQYCQYRRTGLPGVGFPVWQIASDGVAIPIVGQPGFDVAGALRNCVWFR